MIQNDTLIINNFDKVCFWLIIGICGATFLFGINYYFVAARVMDDAYMYVRYADNIIAQGTISWNRGGEATYGLTGPLFLSVVLPLRLLFSNNVALASAFSSLLCGVLFVALLLFLLDRYMNTDYRVKWAFVAATLSYLAIRFTSFLPHFTTGMDTTFSLCFITAYIIASKWYEQFPSTKRAVAMGLYGGLAFSARPDLMLYSFIVPGYLFLFAPDKESRYKALLVIMVTAAAVGAQLLFTYFYFQSPLPLPFYAKGTKLYGEYFYERMAKGSRHLILGYLKTYEYLFLIIAAGIIVNLKKWMRDTSAVDKGLILATILYLLYFHFFVAKMMDKNFRFYSPTLPVIIFLASQSLVHITKEIPVAVKQQIQNIPGKVLGVALVFLLPYILFPLARSFNLVLRERFLNGYVIGNFDVLVNYKRHWRGVWFALDDFSALPDDLVMATSDVGLPGVLNPGKVIIDLAALHETDFAHQGVSAELLFKKYRPDLIYTPVFIYKQLIESFSNNTVFIEDYHLFSKKMIGASFGVALRKDSKYYHEMKEIVQSRINKAKDGSKYL
jgi:hypothetical protein